MKRAFEIHNEFILHKFNTGIKLTRPDNDHISINRAPIPLQDLMNQPFSVWICDENSTNIMVNEDCADVCGYESPLDMIGTTAFDFLNKKQANIAVNHDQNVLKSNSLGIIDFDFIRNDDFQTQFLDFKLPLYNESDEIIGTFACGIDMKKENVADSMAKLLSTGLLSINAKYSQFNNIYLSKREHQCLHYTIRGRSAKQIAKILDLSPRTIEEYIQNIKIKFNVTTKSELIEKAIDLV